MQPGLQPLLPLRARPMRPRLRTHRPSTHLLQVVVAHRSCGRQRSLHVIRIHNPPRLRRVRPHSRKTVSLQLQIHRKRIPLTRILLRQPSLTPFNPQQLLDMMPQLMRDHVGLRELRRASSKLLQLIPEAQIDIDLLVLRTVKRSRRRLRRPAPGVSRPPIQHQLRMTIRLPHLLEDAGPRLLRIVQHKRDQLHILILARRMRSRRTRLPILLRALLRRIALLVRRLSSTGQHRPQKVMPGDQRDHQQHDNPQNANAAAASATEPESAPAAGVAPVLNVAAYSTRSPIQCPYLTVNSKPD